MPTKPGTSAAAVDATRMSQALASERPAPATGPFTAAITGTESGMHVLVNIQGVSDADSFIETARASGVGIYSARSYYLGSPPAGASFLMGYSSVNEDGIRRGIEILAQVAGNRP